MSKYTQNLISNLAIIIVLIILAFVSWLKPFYLLFGDSTLAYFVWLGLFFILLDIVLEIFFRSVKDMRLMAENIGLARDLKKISGGFNVVSKFTLDGKFRADHIVVGSSGVWLITVKDDRGKIEFNGDEIIQNGVVLGGFISRSLEMAYGLTAHIKDKSGKDIKIAPVIAFSSPQTDLSQMPKTVRGVFISSRKDIVSLVENTDFQLIDKNTIEEIKNILTKK